MYELAASRLDQAGYRQYEISNWAKPGHECRHNLQYWHNLPYLGLGAGAHGFVPGYRTANVRSLVEYIRRFQPGVGSQPAVFPATPATQELVSIDPETEMGETMMMGLRLTREGVSDTHFQARFGRSLRSSFRPGDRFPGRTGFAGMGWRLPASDPPGPLIGQPGLSILCLSRWFHPSVYTVSTPVVFTRKLHE